MSDANPYESPHHASVQVPAIEPRFTFNVVHVLVVIAIFGTLFSLIGGPYLEHRRWRRMRERRQLLQPPVVQRVETTVDGTSFSGKHPPNQP